MIDVYRALRQFERLLPGIYPDEPPDDRKMFGDCLRYPRRYPHIDPDCGTIIATTIYIWNTGGDLVETRTERHV